MKIRQNKKKTKKKNGRPKKIPLDLQPQDRPENFPSILSWLNSTGNVDLTTKAELLKAKHMYIRGDNAANIAKAVGHDVNVIERWALIFDWEEERDRRLYEKFRKVSGLRDRMSRSLGERHDRIAGSIEQCAERLLHQHQNSQEELAPRDLATIASTIKTTQEIRRTARGQSKPTDKKEIDVGINLNMPASLEKLASAMVDANEPPKLETRTTKGISVKFGEAEIGTDTEFEED